MMRASGAAAVLVARGVGILMYCCTVPVKPLPTSSDVSSAADGVVTDLDMFNGDGVMPSADALNGQNPDTGGRKLDGIDDGLENPPLDSGPPVDAVDDPAQGDGVFKDLESVSSSDDKVNQESNQADVADGLSMDAVPGDCLFVESLPMPCTETGKPTCAGFIDLGICSADGKVAGPWLGCNGATHKCINNQCILDTPCVPGTSLCIHNDWTCSGAAAIMYCLGDSKEWAIWVCNKPGCAGTPCAAAKP